MTSNASVGKLAARVVIALALGSGAAVAAPASPAHAAGWLGQCESETFPTGIPGYTGIVGWCDGNGPNWHYQALVTCADGRTGRGIARWAGDRRKSIVYCVYGATLSARIDTYYLY